MAIDEPRHDPIARLERLSRLRDEGTLPPDEFATAKTRVLAGQRHARGKPGLRYAWVAVIIVACLLAGIAAWLVGRNVVESRPDPGVATANAAHARPSILSAPNPAPTATPSPTVRDLSAALALSDAPQCIFSPTADRAFKAMLDIDRDTGRPLPLRHVVLDDLRLVPEPEVRKVDDVVEGGRVYVSEVRLPETSIWNGLRLGRMVAEYGSFPETDDYLSRAITFRDPPGRVRAVMKRLGVTVPAGGYAELDDDRCGGAMEIKPIAGGAILSCSWGC